MALKLFSDTYTNKVLRATDSLKGAKINPITNTELNALVQNINFRVKVFNQQKYVDALSKGDIILVRANSLLPCWGGMINNKLVMFVNINRYDILDADGNVKTNFNIRAILGLIAIGLAQRSFLDPHTKDKIYNSAVLRLSAMNVYNRIVVRNIDMMYAISSSPLINRSISFLVNKFFLISVYGMDPHNPNIDNIAFNDGSIGSITLGHIQTHIKDINNSVYEDFNTFIEMLRDRFPMVRGMDAHSFIRNQIIKLGEYSVLLLENYQFLLGLMISVTLQSNIIRDIRISSIVNDKDVNKLVSEFFAKL